MTTIVLERLGILESKKWAPSAYRDAHNAEETKATSENAKTFLKFLSATLDPMDVILKNCYPNSL